MKTEAYNTWSDVDIEIYKENLKIGRLQAISDQFNFDEVFEVQQMTAEPKIKELKDIKYNIYKDISMGCRKVIENKKCTCGSEKAGSNLHSNWCDKYE